MPWRSALLSRTVLCVANISYLFLSEVAELARVSVDTVRFWVRAGKLASVRPGRRRMVQRDVLDTFLQRGATVDRKARSHAQ